MQAAEHFGLCILMRFLFIELQQLSFILQAARGLPLRLYPQCNGRCLKKFVSLLLILIYTR
jgi:hypothetical protein